MRARVCVGSVKIRSVGTCSVKIRRCSRVGHWNCPLKIGECHMSTQVAAPGTSAVLRRSGNDVRGVGASIGERCVRWPGGVMPDK